jgi:hypothetical protein
MSLKLLSKKGSDMAIILINLAKVAMRGINKGLRDMFSVALEEPPQFIREELSKPPHLFAEKDECLALVTLKHEAVQGSGFVSATIKKKVGRRLLSAAGVEVSSEEEIGDAMGEFCSLVAGAFKLEMFNLGRGLISVSVPKYFLKGLDEDLTTVSVLSHYLITINHQKEFLMSMELAFTSTGCPEGDDSKSS